MFQCAIRIIAGHTDAMLVVSSERAARLPPPVVHAGEAAAQEASALSLAPRASVSLRRLGVLRAARRRTVRAALAG